MQQTQETKNVPIHIKVAYGTDFRRFLLNPITFVQLETMLKTLFNLTTEFRVKFKDDEGDWVLITTDQELVYATELSGSPLRLEIHVSSTPFAETKAEVEVQPEVSEWFGRGRGRGGRGRGAGRGCGNHSHEERLSIKSSRLTERINQLEEKLSSEKLSSDRERVLNWRLANLKEKLEFVKTKQASFETVPRSSDDSLTSPLLAEPFLAVPETEIEKPSGRGGCRRGRGGCRGGMRRAMGEEGERPRKCRKNQISPETMAAFRQAKTNLREARDSGDAEKVKVCLEAFHAVKEAKFQEARAAKCAEETDEVKA